MGASRGLWAGATFLVGFMAALWLAGATAGAMRGPRAGLMRELNALRGAAERPPLRSDRHLGQVAAQHAQALARGSALAAASGALELERRARSQGWRGRGPLAELRLRARDAQGELHTLVAGEAGAVLLDTRHTRAGVGLASAADGSQHVVVLLGGDPPSAP
jgi:uncharacterized protein YkwD